MDSKMNVTPIGVYTSPFWSYTRFNKEQKGKERAGKGHLSLLKEKPHHQQLYIKYFGTTLVWVPLIIEHLNVITDCKFGRHDTEHYNK